MKTSTSEHSALLAVRRKSKATQFPAAFALLPTALIVLCVYLGCLLWTVALSFTSSSLLPRFDWVGLSQYARLLSNARFLVSSVNISIYGVLFIFGCLGIGFLLATLLDQRIRGEGIFRTVFLYPHAVSYIVTGLAWQWLLNPSLGLQNFVRGLGYSHFTFDWIINQKLAIYTIVIAGLWHGAGLTMVLMLAGLRGVDKDLWSAARIDGVPTWRVYVSIILPLLRPTVVTSTVLLSIGVVKLYDLVVAMTMGGPGIATEVPAKFVTEHLFERNNIALGSAAATVMLLAVTLIVTPWLYNTYIRPQRRHQ